MLVMKKKSKRHEKTKQEPKFQDYKNCLDKINYLEKNNIEVDSIKENNKEFLRKQYINIKIAKAIWKRETWCIF